MKFMPLAFFFLLSIIIFSPLQSFAENKTIVAQHKCSMGENDSKNDVRKMCFLEAKRKVLEQAGVFIERSTTVKNYKLTSDELSSYSSAFLQVETLSEKWEVEGGNFVFLIEVKADVDSSVLEKQLTKVFQNSDVQNRIKNQQGKLQHLENQVLQLQRQLGSSEATTAASLRKERNVVFKKIDTLQAKKIAIMEKIKSQTKSVKELIELGMTRKEVQTLVGNPRSGSRKSNYGQLTIIYTEGVVGCIVENACKRTIDYCDSYRSFANQCVIK